MPGRRRRLAFSSLAVVAVLLTACQPVDPPPPPTSGPGCEPLPARTERAIAYQAVPAGMDPDLVSLDLYVPARRDCQPLPVLVWVHGGGWRGGDKAFQLGAKRAVAAKEGWVLASVNYRLSPVVRWPVHDNDVAGAVAWLHSNIRAYGGDPDRMVLAGHSAGASIVASVGSDPRYLDTAEGSLDMLCGVFPVDGDFDIEERAASGSFIHLQAFGTDPAVWKQASPLANVAAGEDTPPFTVITRGSRARVDVSRRFVATLDGVGARAEVVVANQYDHLAVNLAIGDPDDSTVTPALVSLVKGCG